MGERPTIDGEQDLATAALGIAGAEQVDRHVGGAVAQLVRRVHPEEAVQPRSPILRARWGSPSASATVITRSSGRATGSAPRHGDDPFSSKDSVYPLEALTIRAL